MGVLSFERETTTAVPPATMFKVFVLESDKYIPKIIPQITIEVLEGNGGPGTIKKTTFAAEGNEFKYIKTIVEATDKDNFTHSYSIIEGEPWMDTLDKTIIEFKIEASGDGGSIIKSTSQYFPKENSQLDEDKIKAGAEKALGTFKAIEAYILANPETCN